MKGTIRKIISLVLSFSFLFQQASFAQMAVELNLAGHLSRMSANLLQEKFRAPTLKYFSYDSLNDSFQLFLDKGDIKAIQGHKVQEEAQVLLNYFLTGVSLPDRAFWVNLRPDASSEVIDTLLEDTDIGKIMLEADLQLKKDTALYTSPQTPEGRQYWDKLYNKAYELYGYDNVSIPTLTRPWIVPGEIIVRESKDSAYVYKAGLRVMLEQDYLSSQPQAINYQQYQFKDERSKELNEYSTQLIRELIIPKLTKEINSSKRYAPLRQVYYSLVLARWFKLRFAGKQGTYASLIDSQNLNNLYSPDSWSKTDYFKQYQKSFTDGEYNLKEPVSTPTGQVIRSYFSGGIALGSSAISTENGIMGGNLSPALLKAGAVYTGKAGSSSALTLQKTDYSSLTRRTFLRGTAATVASLALPSAFEAAEQAKSILNEGVVSKIEGEGNATNQVKLVTGKPGHFTATWMPQHNYNWGSVAIHYAKPLKFVGYRSLIITLGPQAKDIDVIHVNYHFRGVDWISEDKAAWRSPQTFIEPDKKTFVIDITAGIEGGIIWDVGTLGIEFGSYSPEGSVLDVKDIQFSKSPKSASSAMATNAAFRIDSSALFSDTMAVAKFTPSDIEGINPRLQEIFTKFKGEIEGAKTTLGRWKLSKNLRGWVLPWVDLLDQQSTLSDSLDKSGLLMRDNKVIQQVIDVATKVREDDTEAWVNIGIGGSDLPGQALVKTTLSPYHNELSREDRKGAPRIYFTGNDFSPDLLYQLLFNLDSQGILFKTKFNVVSKSGTTAETIAAYLIIKSYLQERLAEISGQFNEGQIDATDLWNKGLIPPDIRPISNEYKDKLGRKRTRPYFKTGRFFIITTGLNEKSALYQLHHLKLNAKGEIDPFYALLPVPEGTGGRFSAFTPVGLLALGVVAPIAVGQTTRDGVKNQIYEALRGVRSSLAEMLNTSPASEENIVFSSARNNYLLEEKGKIGQLFYIYDPTLEQAGQLMGQLSAESLQEKGQGQILQPLLGSNKNHSYWNGVVNGRRNVFVTFVTTGQYRRERNFKVPEGSGIKGDVAAIEGFRLGEIQKASQEGTAADATENGVPNYTLTIPKADVFNVAKLIYTLQSIVAVEGKLRGLEIQTNEDGTYVDLTYLQSGVEGYKTRTKQILAKMRQKKSASSAATVEFSPDDEETISSSSALNTPEIKFGTSGWRWDENDYIKHGFFNKEAFLRDIYAAVKASAEQVRLQEQQNPGRIGVVISGDTRQTGPFTNLDLTTIASQIFASMGIKVYRIDQYCPLPVVSFLINNLKAAGSLYFTASHNPGRDFEVIKEDGSKTITNYNGLKFNPAHSGPAEEAITNAMQTKANELRKQKAESSYYASLHQKNIRSMKFEDIAKLYTEALGEVIDFNAIQKAFKEGRLDYIAIDPKHGTATEFYRYIMNYMGLKEGVQFEIINAEPDPSFTQWNPKTGVTKPDRPEPAEAYSQHLVYRVNQLRQEGKKVIGVSADPDADRNGVVSQEGVFIDPNVTLSIEAQYLLQQEFVQWLEIKNPGLAKTLDLFIDSKDAYTTLIPYIKLFAKERDVAIAKTIPTSNMMNEIAKRWFSRLYETKVGFKWLRDPLLSNARIAGEESQGLNIKSLKNNPKYVVLEKDALVAGLKMIEVVAVTGLSAQELFEKLQAQIGYFAYNRGGVDLLTKVSKDKIDELKKALKLQLDELKSQIQKGEIKELSRKIIAQAIFENGYKIVFSDNSWLCIRFSGTEPVVRLYTEAMGQTKEEAELIRKTNHAIGEGLLELKSAGSEMGTQVSSGSPVKAKTTFEARYEVDKNTTDEDWRWDVVDLMERLRGQDKGEIILTVDWIKRVANGEFWQMDKELQDLLRILQEIVKLQDWSRIASYVDRLNSKMETLNLRIFNPSDQMISLQSVVYVSLFRLKEVKFIYTPRSNLTKESAGSAMETKKSSVLTSAKNQEILALELEGLVIEDISPFLKRAELDEVMPTVYFIRYVRNSIKYFPVDKPVIASLLEVLIKRKESLLDIRIFLDSYFKSSRDTTKLVKALNEYQDSLLSALGPALWLAMHQSNLSNREAREQVFWSVLERQLKPASSAVQTVPEAPGGIDLRTTPMNIQFMGSFTGLNLKLPRLSQAQLERINIISELEQLNRMASSGIRPSDDRIQQLLAACQQKGELSAYADNLLLCLIDICKLDEENAYESSSKLKQALVIVDSLS